MGDSARIRAFLAAVRARLRLRQMLMEGAVVAGASFGVLLLFLMAVASARPSSSFRIALATLMALAAAGLISALARPFTRWGGDERVARFVGEQTGAGDLVLSAVELTQSLARCEADPAFGSPALARAHLAQVAARLSEHNPGTIARWRPSNRALGTAGALAFFDMVVLLSSGSQVRAGWAALLRTRPTQAVTMSPAPVVGDIDIHLVFPPHTALSPRDIPGSSGEVVAPPGTEVTLHARPLVPSVRGAHLLLEDASGKKLEERPATFRDGRLESHFKVTRPGAWRLVLERGGVRGMAGPLREPESHRIDLEVDRAPRVTLAAPADDLELPAVRRIELAFSAEDDYGLHDLTLVWSGPDGSGPDGKGRLEGRSTVRAKVDGRTVSGIYEWDLAHVELKPGIALSYHLEARDNDVVSGPNVGVSKSFTVRVHSAEEKHDELLAAQQALADRAVSVLADRLDATRAGATEVRRELDAIGAAHLHEQAFVEELTRVQGLAARDPLAPRALKAALEGMRQRLGRLHRDEEPLARQARERVPGDGVLRALREGNGRHVSELEKDALLLADLLGRQRLEQLLAIADEMQSARDRLKQLLADYKKTRNEAVRAEIEREMRRLSQKLTELAQKASRLEGEVPDEFVNREAMRSDDMKGSLDQIRDLLAKGEVDKAMEAMEKLSSSIDRMVASMENDLKGYRNERFSAEEKALAELEGRLSDLEHDERQLQADTDEVLRRQREQRKRVVRDRIDPFVKKAKERAAEIKKGLASLDRKQIPATEHETLDKAKRRVEDLQGALDQGDLEEAREMARQAGGEMNQLELDLRDEEERRWEATKAPVRRTREKVSEARGMANEIVRDIDQMMPQPGQMLSPQDEKRLGELAARQEAVRRRAEEARRELERRLPERDGMKQGLRQVGEHMQRAGGSLRRGNARDGSGEQGQALERLSQLRRNLQNERRPRDEDGAGSQGAKELVKIPGADEFRAPREFRQDLLEAMKREAPGAYKEQVKRYYEELVR